MRIAVLIASHNRRETTLECLRSLGSFHGKVFLTDGGSTDGTADAVEKEFPDAKVIRRGSDVWWAGGMRLAWEAAAAEGGWDGYLWLNDDVKLAPGALAELMSATDGRTVVTGMLREPGTDVVSYGADDLGLKKIPAEKKVDVRGFLHGNCLLVPALVYAEVGGMSPRFVHNFADMEFGERLRRKGMRIVAVGPVGACARHPPYDRRLFRTMSFSERLAAIRDPKRIAAKDWIWFKRLTRGRFWAALSAIKMGLLVLCPRLVVRP